MDLADPVIVIYVKNTFLVEEWFLCRLKRSLAKSNIKSLAKKMHSIFLCSLQTSYFITIALNQNC